MRFVSVLKHSERRRKELGPRLRAAEQNEG